MIKVQRGLTCFVRFIINALRCLPCVELQVNASRGRRGADGELSLPWGLSHASWTQASFQWTLVIPALSLSAPGSFSGRGCPALP